MIFENVFKQNTLADNDPLAVRISVDTKATLHVGEYSRGGQSRTLTPLKAIDHDMAVKEKLIPVGILEPGTGASYIAFGNSNKTSDLIADGIEQWYKANSDRLRSQMIERLVINADNGPECNSQRTQFMRRMVDFADASGLEIRMVYYPPYHSKYNPIEHFWGGLERSWNGYLLDDVSTVLERAGSFTWRKVKTAVSRIFGEYPKGITLTKQEKSQLEERLIRLGSLPKWDVKITPKTVN
jgi:hypothetical protein